MPNRYTPNPMEISAMRALAVSGAIRVKCHSDKAASYQRNRMRGFINARGCGPVVKLAVKRQSVYGWMVSRHTQSAVSPLIMAVADKPENTFVKGEYHHRDYQSDSEVLLDVFTFDDKPIVTPSAGKNMIIQLANKQLAKEVITQEEYDKIVKEARDDR